MSTGDAARQRRALARAVRDACVEAALDGYEQASISGLCAVGAWEAAVSAIRQLDVDVVLGQSGRPGPKPAA